MKHYLHLHGVVGLMVSLGLEDSGVLIVCCILEGLLFAVSSGVSWLVLIIYYYCC